MLNFSTSVDKLMRYSVTCVVVVNCADLRRKMACSWYILDRVSRVKPRVECAASFSSTHTHNYNQQQ